MTGTRLSNKPEAPRAPDAFSSSAGWSEGPTPPVRGASAAPARKASLEGARYVVEEVIGRGGMGEVRRAHDALLSRDVALKRVAGDAPAQADRLLREAWVTAHLDHPSIVPVYDTGEDEHGRAFFTMRLIHGRTLADALRELSIDDRSAREAQRQQLLRHFLAAGQAIAFAHNHGVVHRDLKPANIMVGAFGETQVVDWGLASSRDDGAGAPAAAPLDDVTGFAGTPAYMSPEQAHGRRVDARADVWALGAVLFEIATGRRFVDARDPARALAQVQGGDFDRAPLLLVPAELRAVIDKATALAEDARYPHAGALVVDFENYLDGKRVTAHDYSTLELVFRVIKRLRVPLAALAVVLLVSASVLAVSFRNITRARERAEGAEQKTARALDDNRRATASALAQQAVVAFQEGALPEAERLAALSLAQAEGAYARGVIVGAASMARPEGRLARIPDCMRVLPHGEGTALCLDATSVSSWAVSPPGASLRWRHEEAARAHALLARGDLALLSGTNVLTLLSGADGRVRARHALRVSTGFALLVAATLDERFVLATEGRVVSVLDVERDLVIDHDRAYTEGGIVAVLPFEDAFILVCTDGAVVRLEPRSGAVTVLLKDRALVALVPVRAVLAGTRLLVGGVRGDVLSLDVTDPRAVTAFRPLHGAITQLQWADAARGRAWIADERHGAALWDVPRQLELLRLPLSTSMALVPTDHGVTSGGAALVSWTLPAAPLPRAWRTGAPIASFALATDGSRVALGLSDGRVQVRALPEGAIEREVRVGDGVIKHLAFRADGALVASFSRSPSVPQRIDLETGALTPLAMPPANARAARRLVFDDGGNLYGVHWQPPLSVWSSSFAITEIDTPELVDANASAGGRTVWLLAVDGGLWRAGAGGVERVDGVAGAQMVAVMPDGVAVVVCHETACVLRRDGVTVRWFKLARSTVTDVAVSADGAWLAAAAADGAITVWRVEDEESDAAVAVLRGHSERVGQIEIDVGGTLWSAGWDGVFTRSDLRALTASASELGSRSERSFPLEDAPR